MKVIGIAILMLVGCSVFAQKEFYQKSLDINKKGMYVLGSWAVGNIAFSGVALLNNPQTEEIKAFHQMNVGWGVINASLATLGILGSRKEQIPENRLGILEAQQKIERTFLVNAALDVAYVSFGLYLNEKGKTSDVRTQGFGKSIIMQGAFLGVFDVAMFAIQKKHYNRNRDQFKVAFGGNRVSMIVPIK